MKEKLIKLQKLEDEILKIVETLPKQIRRKIIDKIIYFLDSEIEGVR